MARDKGNFYVASDWFKDALQINQVPYHRLLFESCVDVASNDELGCLIVFIFPLNLRITRTPGP